MPVLRPMAAEFPDDPACAHLDRQYMLGDRRAGRAGVHRIRRDVLLPPRGDVDAPADRRHRTRPGWVHEVCDFSTVPVYVRPGSVLPLGARDDRPDYAYAEDVTLRAYELADGAEAR